MELHCNRVRVRVQNTTGVIEGSRTLSKWLICPFHTANWYRKLLCILGALINALICTLFLWTPWHKKHTGRYYYHNEGLASSRSNITDRMCWTITVWISLKWFSFVGRFGRPLTKTLCIYNIILLWWRYLDQLKPVHSTFEQTFKRVSPIFLQTLTTFISILISS